VEVPAELLNKPFKELTKEERILVSRARSRAMRAKAGVPVASKTDGAPAAAQAAPAAAQVTPAAATAAPPAQDTVAASAEVAVDPMAEVPPELLQKPFKDLTKEERVIVSRARSRAMRAKAGLPVGGAAEADLVAAPVDEAPQAEPAVEEPSVVAQATDGDAAADPMAEVPPELLGKPFKDLTKEERIIVSRARSRAMRAKAGKPVGSSEA
jgi:hypothetical protein